MPGKIFFSYAHDDYALVAPYLNALRARVLEPWIDRDEIGPGADFVDRINEALRHPNAVIFHSATYAAHEFTRKEMNVLIAAELSTQGRTLVVVRLDDTPVPPLLSTKQWIRGGNPEDLANFFSGQPVPTAHPATLAIGGSKPQPPSIDEFLDPLEDQEIERLAKALRDHLDLVGASNRETTFRATVHRSPVGFVARRDEMNEDDLRASLQNCQFHRRFINDFAGALAEDGLSQNERTGISIRLEKRLHNLDRERAELRGLLKGLLLRYA